ncbi:MAG: HAD-IA family hydrolase [Verrucomicrobiia bacterium]|jgi:putative hydrolase of the HAD superfamily
MKEVGGQRRKLRAVTFDAGGTLFYPHPSVGEIYAAAARRHGATADAAAMEEGFRRAWVACHHDDAVAAAGNVSQREWWREMVFQTLAMAGVTMPDREAYFDELYELFARPEVWRLFPDAVETLTAVRRRGLKVGLLSNWDHRLRPVLEGLGLMPLLDAVTISCEVGAEKPDPKIFHAAWSALGVARGDEVLHVGDSYRDDVLGALAVGMGAVLAERAGKHPWDGATIRRLGELVGLLDEGRNEGG